MTLLDRLQQRRRLIVLLLWVSGCDWDGYALLNSVPIDGDPKLNPVVHVYLAVDGLPYELVKQAVRVGIVPEKGVSVAKFLSMFPATSDASWTRILHTLPMKGDELTFYNPVADEIINTGYTGIVAHGVPPVAGTSLSGPAYLAAFDYHADGYLDTLLSYTYPETAFAESLDNLFFLLAARAEHSHVFFGYLLEIDIFGHMSSRQQVYDAFVQLWHRIEAFKQRHPERRFVFTLLSDHGNDFIKATDEQFIDFRDELMRLGVVPVDRLAEGNYMTRPFAVPVIHTPMTYVALHTTMRWIDDVARRSSMSPYVDLVIARAEPDSDIDAKSSWQWFAIWRAGRQLARVGYDLRADHYYLPMSTQWHELSLSLPSDMRAVSGNSSREYVAVSDEQLFDAAARGPYPDLLYRARTALEPICVRYPGNVYVSFKRPYTSAGFLDGGLITSAASSGFHGNLDDAGSSGVVLSEERTLPHAIRSDTFLQLFPRLEKYMRSKNVAVRTENVGAALLYDRLIK